VGLALRERHPELVETADVFRHVALEARSRLVFLVPFFDVHGGRVLLDLFTATPAVTKILICRDVDDLREAACGLDVELAKCGVTVRSYKVLQQRKAAGWGVETFHAKIALADATCAYVGSANAMRSSLETTMECGVLLRGPAVNQVKDLVDTLLEHC
jgi:phosphatidylserine/phosphatidylglycerophosphate/cardiolipin synthase-like enzyme